MISAHLSSGSIRVTNEWETASTTAWLTIAFQSRRAREQVLPSEKGRKQSAECNCSVGSKLLGQEGDGSSTHSSSSPQERLPFFLFLLDSPTARVNESGPGIATAAAQTTSLSFIPKVPLWPSYPNLPDKENTEVRVWMFGASRFGRAFSFVSFISQLSTPWNYPELLHSFIIPREGMTWGWTGLYYRERIHHLTKL